MKWVTDVHDGSWFRPPRRRLVDWRGSDVRLSGVRGVRVAEEVTNATVTCLRLRRKLPQFGISSGVARDARRVHFRREGGLPVHRVVANLGRVSDPVQLENLEAAFSANRIGERLAPVTAATAEPAIETARLRKPQAILRYLDVAVVVATLQELGLSTELARLLPMEESDVAPERIITSLVAPWCIDLAATCRITSFSHFGVVYDRVQAQPSQIRQG